MTSDPRVSVLLITYNHEKYIEQAARSALMQQTDFVYEIVVAEDCSTDGTRDVLRRLDAEQPGRMRLLFRERNLGPFANSSDSYAACRGEYIAFLEGDDYWTDPAKLKKQVGELDKHPEWSGCFHHTEVKSEESGERLCVMPAGDHKRVFELDDMLRHNEVATASVVYRRAAVPELPRVSARLPMGDWPLHITAARRGPIGCLPDLMAVYRIHAQSGWSSRPYPDQLHEVLRMFWVMAAEADDELKPKLEAAGRNYLARALAEREKHCCAELQATKNSYSWRLVSLLRWPLDWVKSLGRSRA